MKKIAILITVYNRKAITLEGLRHLHNVLSKNDTGRFGIFLVDDGSTDGTADAVRNSFPDVHIIKGDGNLYWSGGMRKAWEVAVQNDKWDYYIWFNDDAMLYDNALDGLFAPIDLFGNKIVVSGAFVGSDGQPSYGGRNNNSQILSPDGTFQDIFLMNGNWVLIPREVFEKIGMIDTIFKHGLGDWDYGLRAQKSGFRVVLTAEYIGETDRHDVVPAPFDSSNSLKTRIKLLFQSRYSLKCQFLYENRHFGIFQAIERSSLICLYAFFPATYRIVTRLTQD